MSKKFKVILGLAVVAIIFLIIGQVIGVQMGALLSNHQSIQIQKIPDNKIVSFGDGEFSIALPDGWVSDGKRAWNPKNPASSITGGRVEIDNNEKTKSLVSGGKIKEFETDLMVRMCQETDACGKISDFKTVKAPEGVQSFEFFITYPGAGVDEPDGFTTEIHRSVLVNGKLYRFWTSTESSAGKNANEIKNFRSIVDTFEVKKNQ